MCNIQTLTHSVQHTTLTLCATHKHSVQHTTLTLCATHKHSLTLCNIQTQSYTYHITGNFCDVKFLRFWSKKKTFNFCGFFFLRIENILYYRKQQQKRCYDKQLVHITVILRSKNIFSSLETFQTLQLLNTHLVNFKFVLRNLFFHCFRDLFCWQEIRSQQLDRYRYKLWYIFILYHITIFKKRIMIRSNCIQFF